MPRFHAMSSSASLIAGRPSAVPQAMNILFFGPLVGSAWEVQSDLPLSPFRYATGLHATHRIEVCYPSVLPVDFGRVALPGYQLDPSLRAARRATSEGSAREMGGPAACELGDVRPLTTQGIHLFSHNETAKCVSGKALVQVCVCVCHAPRRR